MNRVPILSGSLADDDLGSVLAALGLTRQLSCVELMSPMGAIEGAIWVKSGQLLDATAGARTGTDALHHLLDFEGSFSVFRVEGEQDNRAPPMMSLGDALERERRDERQPERVATIVSHPSSSSAPSNAGPVLAVFSNKGGVGKTTFAINLAVAFARRGLRTTLVDADPRNDVGTALAARRDTSAGLFDVIDGTRELREVLLETALPGFTILSAGGVGLPEERFLAATGKPDRLADVLAGLAAPNAIVVVDTPPGLRGVTSSVLRASTHALAVVQAEPIALRSAAHVPRALSALPAQQRPALVGVALNMLDRRVGATLGAIEEACEIFGAEKVLDIAVPRSGALVEASVTGAPVALHEDGDGTHAIGWLFESLASDVLARAGLATPKFAELRLL